MPAAKHLVLLLQDSYRVRPVRARMAVRVCRRHEGSPTASKYISVQAW
jgi:hypothetical protein